MGVNLILKYKGESIADLGRAYHFEDIDVEEDICDYKKKLVMYAAYIPKCLEELEEIEEDVCFIVEELLRCGGKRLMDCMVKDEDNLEIVKE
uniref:Uncharacterized protein n=1 Tax=viral metagenome TaxID=1070528 RepID=A0A6M3JTY0_9ZZZZ